MIKQSERESRIENRCMQKNENEMNGWLEVSNGLGYPMPDKDCKIWIARCGMGTGWIQQVDYDSELGYIDWDGTVAYQIAKSDETPKPFLMQWAGNKKILCEEILR